nr:hypothetical protein [Nannocystis sp.]
MYGVIALVAVDADGEAVLQGGADGEGVAVVAQGDAGAELVLRVGVRGLDIGLLRPGRARPGVHIDGAGAGQGVAGLVAADARGAAALRDRGDGEGVAVAADREVRAEVVAGVGVRGLDVADRLGERAGDLDRLGLCAGHAVARPQDVARVQSGVQRHGDGDLRRVGGEVLPDLHIGFAGARALHQLIVAGDDRRPREGELLDRREVPLEDGLTVRGRLAGRRGGALRSAGLGGGDGQLAHVDVRGTSGEHEQTEEGRAGDGAHGG